jgi:hypothetical protein
MLRQFFAVGVLAATSFIAGCESHAAVGYRVYDPYYSDYHVWGPPEVEYYNQWVIETHRPHREFKALRPEEQHEYWNWRHHHGDRH